MNFLKKILSLLMRPRQIYFYALISILVPNVALCFTEHYDIGTALCNIVVPLSVYAYLFTCRRKPGAMVWILFPFFFLAAFQLVLLYLFGNSIIAVDMFLNLVTTNASEALELLDNLIPAVSFVFFLYIPILIFAGISIKRKSTLSEGFSKRMRKISGIGMACSVLLLLGTYSWGDNYEAKVDLFPLNVCYNCYLAVERTEDVENYADSSKDFCYRATPTHGDEQPEIYLFVIGETGRACNWGLYGYERNTTPKLAKQKGLVYFTDVLTQSNTTHKSVPMLLSMASAEHYDRIYQEKSIITAFKEAGFYTAYYSNQKYNHAFIDIFGKEANSSVFLKEEGLPERNINDTELEKMVDNLLKQGHKKLFIVLHTYGSHFNYKERYPEKIAFFKPDKIADVHPKYRQVLVNAYDNTILQTDMFLSHLIDRLKEQKIPAVMIYTSDHGEDIFDDSRELFLHSSPVPSYYQLHVPFLIWMSEEYAAAYPKILNQVKSNRNKAVSSNVTVAFSLLQMAGLETPYREDSLSVASDKYRQGQRYYINDHNLPKPYDDIGMDEEDYQQFRQRHITFP